mmetsp:Transcript_108693/g.307403  ORF Transcript_108693/g.307403 Transcript_108693/m.307403 type:complete len:251 (+) Transcript_108693:77-829(+)
MADPLQQCAICYEAVAQGIELPCNCKVDYCMQCWDKALAKSFNACAQARCPTCRTPVRVDFCPDTGCPTFTPEYTEEDADSLRRRICEQMKPFQVRILQEFGAAHPIAQDLGSEAAPAHAARLQEAGIAPQCVCGSALRRVTLQERARQFLVQADAWRNSGRLAPLITQGIARVVCDLCGDPLDVRHPAVWVCERGDGTIKHATSNDVCAWCFIWHAWGVDVGDLIEKSEEAGAGAPPPEAAGAQTPQGQ